jgi:hypothetical protein
MSLNFEVPKVDKSTDISRRVGFQGLGDGELLFTEFQFCKIKRVFGDCHQSGDGCP